MRFITCNGFGDPDVLEVRTGPVPEAGAGDVVVKVSHMGINRADLVQRIGRYPPPPGFDPYRPGLEYAGVVAETGPDAGAVDVGDRVMGLVGGGAYAQYLVTDAATCIRVPDRLTDAEAAAVPETFLTAYDAIWLQGGMPANGWCLVRAATSGVGMAACQLARALGARVIATSRSAERAAALATFEPAGTIIEGEEDLAARVRELTDKRGVDVVLDLVGGKGSGAALESLSRGGTLMLVGIMGGARSEFNLARILTSQLTVLGTTMRNRALDQRRHLASVFTERILPLLAEGTLRPVVDRIMPATEVAAAHRLIETNQQLGKVVLAWD